MTFYVKSGGYDSSIRVYALRRGENYPVLFSPRCENFYRGPLPPQQSFYELRALRATRLVYDVISQPDGRCRLCL